MPLTYTGTFYAELGQDAFVLEMLKEKRCGYFVEFGAMTGKMYSNTYILEKEFDWQGIVSEPNPRFHKELFENRSCIIDNRAVYNKTGAQVNFVCREHGYSGLTDSKQKYDGHEIIQVESVTLSDLLSAHDPPDNIDYISIDTEGTELEILQTFDFSKYRVSVWTIEHNYHEDRRLSIQRIMAENGYVHVKADQSRYDDWFVDKNLI